MPKCRFIQILYQNPSMLSMEHRFLLALCFWFTLFLCRGSSGCFEQERIGLLQLKASMKDPLLTWVDDETSDCCSWERVECNITTNRVIQLKLNQTYGGGYLNASLFLPFQQLQHLDLSDNLLRGWENNQGFERLSELKLEVLNLKNNLFKNDMFPSLGELTSLKTLYLGGNGLEGSLSEYSQVFRNMSNLEFLDLSLNQLDGFLPFHDLSNTSKLKLLDLSSNRMSGKIPLSILKLNSLEALSIALNDLKDFISGICHLKNLKELDLSRNRLEGPLPACLSNLTSLRELDVSENQLNGELSPSLISSLTLLEYISISENRFEGSALFMSLVDHRSQFKFLGLSNCNLNISTDDLLKLLYNQYGLRGVDLSHNNLHGRFPTWLIENNTNLEFLVLRNNSLHGHIRFPHHQLVNLEWFDVSTNHLQGKLQTDMGDALPKLKCFNICQNYLEGRIPTSIGNMKELTYLNLIYNNFTGEIPLSLGLGCQKLKVLLLCYNRLHGRIPPTLFNLTYLDTLHIKNNELTGYIPGNIMFFSVRVFDISQNHLSGNVPTWIGNLTTLTTFSIHHNSFDGPIPVELCNLTYLEYLDLSQNQIVGWIPSCLINLPSLNYLHLQRNKLTGSIPRAFPNKSKLLTLDLTHNNLSGSIPNSLGLLSSLRVVLLKKNRLSGIIPQELCRSSNISILDLSHNMLSGSIPRCFGNISFGKVGVADPLSFIRSEVGSVQTLNYNYLYKNLFGYVKNLETLGYMIYLDKEQVDFMTKRRRSTYKGGILNFMSGMDLSYNHLTGDIPLEIGSLTGMRALNLSHNQFTGLIPENLSKLKWLESMDLSHNRLSGEIPPTLTNIYTLEVFTVAYNNLSGRIPDMKAQFSTFSETSYVGNPFLCGAPLPQQCTTITDPVKRTLNEWSEKHGIDRNSFLRSFAVSYFICFLGYVIVYLIGYPWQCFS